MNFEKSSKIEKLFLAKFQNEKGRRWNKLSFCQLNSHSGHGEMSEYGQDLNEDSEMLQLRAKFKSSSNDEAFLKALKLFDKVLPSFPCQLNPLNISASLLARFNVKSNSIKSCSKSTLKAWKQKWFLIESQKLSRLLMMLMADRGCDDFRLWREGSRKMILIRYASLSKLSQFGLSRGHFHC